MFILIFSLILIPISYINYNKFIKNINSDNDKNSNFITNEEEFFKFKNFKDQKINELSFFLSKSVTIQSRLYYNFNALNNLQILPKKNFLNYRNNEIEKIIKQENLLKLNTIPVVKIDIYKGNNFNLNSALIYFVYDYGILLSIPFLIFNYTIIKNIFFNFDISRKFLILPYYIISFLAQSNFSNILMWIILLYLAKRNK